MSVTPSGETLSINRGDLVTYSADVTLHLFCKAATQVQIVNGSTSDLAVDTAWVDYAEEVAWTLDGQYGLKEVAVKYRLEEDNESSAVSTTILWQDTSTLVQTGSCGKAMDNLRWLLAGCTSYQSWTGTTSLLGALPSIHRRIYRQPLIRPFSLIRSIPTFRDEGYAEGGPQFEGSGAFELWFEADPQNLVMPIDWETECLIFARDIGSVIEELKQNQGINGAFCISSIEEQSDILLPTEEMIQGANGDPDYGMIWQWKIGWR